MAKKKQVPEGAAVPTAEELEREAANAAADMAKERAARKRRVNADKQARFRKSMKEQGYQEVKHWEKPLAPGMVKPWGKFPPPLIHEGTAGICERDEKAKAAVSAMMAAFLLAVRENDNLAPEEWTLYRDIECLLSPLGYKEE